MADRIDIEEHDIMENPAMKRMLPDLSELKKEIDRKSDSAIEANIFFQKHDLFQEKKPNQQIEYVEHAICDSQFSKARNLASLLADAVAPENKLLQGNKIILGSKPNTIEIDEDYFESCVKPSQASVVLHDVQPYLQKSKRYCETCEILFSEPSNYENHLKLYHPQTCTKQSSKSKILVKRSYKHKCNVCVKTFDSNFMLETHMEITHNLSPIQQNLKPIQSKNKIVNQKKLENNNSDLSNTCFHCKQIFETQKSLIEHLYDILKTKRTETEIIPVLNSVLFRCNKCDIHFVSSQVAANHCDHMELLINWKCSICYRIFKKEDELSHERQHSVSNNFVIYNVSDLDLNKVLFKCSKCSGHFSESTFLYHFRDCGLKTNKLQYCSICNILIDSSLKLSHETEHINLFTVIETEVISDNPVKQTGKEKQMKKNLNNILETIREVRVVLQKLDTSDKFFTQKRSGTKINPHSDASLKYQKIVSLKSPKFDKDLYEKTKNDKCNKLKTKLVKTKQKGNDEEIPHKKKKPNNIDHTKALTSKNGNTIHFRKLNQAYFYCEDCTCFIPKQRNVRHMQSRCTNLKKNTCKYCGLMLTLTSFRTHKRLHERHSDLKLHNFKFFNLNNGKPMSPPIPKYPNCGICGVQFVSKTALLNHVCSEEAYLTCQICAVKLSEAAFKLHSGGFTNLPPLGYSTFAASEF